MTVSQFGVHKIDEDVAGEGARAPQGWEAVTTVFGFKVDSGAAS